MRRDSSVSIATGYGLDGRGSILGRGRDFYYDNAGMRRDEERCFSTA
jgi:hypothetical protein